MHIDMGNTAMSSENVNHFNSSSSSLLFCKLIINCRLRDITSVFISTLHYEDQDIHFLYKVSTLSTPFKGLFVI